MKTSQWTAASAAVFVLSVLSLSRAQAQSTIPATPSGVMTAFPTVVQTGTKPTLTWNILYPATIGTGTGPGGNPGSGGGNNGSDPIVLVNPPGTLIPGGTIFTTVQIVGSGVTACDPTQDLLGHFADARISFNGGAYQQIFYGRPASVIPSKQVYIKKMSANQKVNFAGRYLKNGVWSPLFTTLSRNFQVVALGNGQTPPTTFPLHLSPNLASYLRPSVAEPRQLPEALP